MQTNLQAYFQHMMASSCDIPVYMDDTETYMYSDKTFSPTRWIQQKIYLPLKYPNRPLCCQILNSGPPRKRWIQRWFSHHAQDVPSIMWHDGHFSWRKLGALHRVQGPAEVFDYITQWYVKDEAHRTDGPARHRLWVLNNQIQTRSAARWRGMSLALALVISQH